MSKQEDNYCINKLSINYQDYFFIWYSDGLVSENNKILLFESLDLLIAYSKKYNIFIHENEITDIYLLKEIINFDYKEPNILKKYKFLLFWWNFLIDVACSTSYKNDTPSYENDTPLGFYKIEEGIVQKFYKNKKRAFNYSKRIYNKLFSGKFDYYDYNRKNKTYKIKWSRSEIKMLNRIIKYGLELFENNIIKISSEEDLKKILSSNDK